MKKICLYTWMALTVLSACKKDNQISHDIQKSFVDPQQALDDFKKQLSTGANGWEGLLIPKEGGVHRVFFQLDDAKKEATLYSDFSAVTAGTPGKATYSLAVAESINPTISFKEGSYLDSIVVKGRTADLNYTFKSVSGDTIRLLGNRYSDELILLKANPQALADYKARYLLRSMAYLNIYLSQARFLYVQPDANTALQITVNAASKIAGITYLASSQKATFNMTDFAYTLNGIYLRRPIIIKGNPIQEILWDATAQNFYFQYGGTITYLKNASFPVIPLTYLLGSPLLPSTLSLLGPEVFSAGGQPIVLPGWSQEYNNIYNAVDLDLYRSFGRFILVKEFAMDVPNKTMTLSIILSGPSGSSLRVPYPYRYTVGTNGAYTFTAVAPTDANAKALQAKAKPLLDVLTAQPFLLDYYDGWSVPGVYDVMVSFKGTVKTTISFTAMFGRVI